jgi:hypothetical protein
MLRRLKITAAPLALLLAISAQSVVAGQDAGSQPVEMLGMRSHVPAGWVAEAPQSNMRVAQFSVPAAGEGDGAAFVVYYFGPGQGGSLEANLERWQSQFSSADGGPVEPDITELSGALPATLVSLRGSYARGVGVGPAGDALPDRMLLAGVVETPKGNLYPQLHGPAALVAAQQPAFVAFIEGLEAVPSSAVDD